MRSVLPSLRGAMALLLAVAAGSASAEDTPSAPPGAPTNPFGRVYPARIYHATRLEGEPPTIDGRLNDGAWDAGEWSGGFKQQMPTEGAAPSQPTEIKILFDEKNVYMAVRAHDDPALIHRYVGRRDEFVGDIVGMCFDSDHDQRSGFEFDLTAGGSKIDLVLTNDGWDTSWDAVWHGKTGIEEGAWTAEFQIPLSQLRYGSQQEQVWGLHVWRWIERNQEEDQWQLIPRTSTGRMYNIGELHGIRDLRRFRHIEILPHALGKLIAEPAVTDDPYRSGAELFGDAGLDAKIGLTTDFTLDVTVNPDFGQVEADPSVINLTAYETFYQEKRPFFLEGKEVMSFQHGGRQLFYSRRIGRPPAYSPDLRDGESIDAPESTTILSALKVTGKNSRGLSLGFMQSLTSSESARLSYEGQERQQAVEPLTAHTVARIQKDWNKGNTILGGMLTSVQRRITDDELDFLPGSALTAGFDFAHHFHNRTYVLEGKGMVSRVAGSAAAIADLETNAVHYYQRPDAEHLTLDEDATTLAGHGGVLRFAREGNSRWRFAQEVAWSSPGLELNDIGYLQQADGIGHNVSLGYEDPRPKGPFRFFSVHVGREDYWDFGRLHTEGASRASFQGLFANKWGAWTSLRVDRTIVDTRRLRGGPAITLSPFVHVDFGFHTDESRRLAGSWGVHKHFVRDGDTDMLNLSPSVRLRLSDRLSLWADLAYTRNRDDLQYVETVESDDATRYVLGHIDQRTLSATFRLNLHLTPDLSIQYYGSPFVSAGEYSRFKRVTNPRAGAYRDRFVELAPEQLTYLSADSLYEVAEVGAAPYSFADPDFSFRQFRSNLVVRWEYRPGATLFLVWSQGRTSEDEAWEGSLHRNYDALFRAKPDNVFLAKISYWFSL